MKTSLKHKVFVLVLQDHNEGEGCLCGQSGDLEGAVVICSGHHSMHLHHVEHGFGAPPLNYLLEHEFGATAT